MAQSTGQHGLLKLGQKRPSLKLFSRNNPNKLTKKEHFLKFSNPKLGQPCVYGTKFGGIGEFL